MSDPSERALLRELAANRGCRLVASRKRTPGRGDYGHFGLKDASTGEPVFGIGKRRLTATADEVEVFLRAGAAAGWKRSLRDTAARKARPAGKSKR